MSLNNIAAASTKLYPEHRLVLFAANGCAGRSNGNAAQRGDPGRRTRAAMAKPTNSTPTAFNQLRNRAWLA